MITFIIFLNIPEIKPCVAPVDVAFVVDSSNSISKTNYQLEKDFVKLIAKQLNIGSSNSRASLVLFSGNAYLEARLDQYNNTKDFQNAVDQLRHLKSTTRIDLALDVTNQVFSTALSRAGVPKVAIVLTDGYLTGGGSADDLREAAKRLWAKNVRVMAVGIGNQVNQRELESMTQSNADIVRSRDFHELKMKVGRIVGNVCGKWVFIQLSKNDGGE